MELGCTAGSLAPAGLSGNSSVNGHVFHVSGCFMSIFSILPPFALIVGGTLLS